MVLTNNPGTFTFFIHHQSFNLLELFVFLWFLTKRIYIRLLVTTPQFDYIQCILENEFVFLWETTNEDEKVIV